jgi:hypothetical protein
MSMNCGLTSGRSIGAGFFVAGRQFPPIFEHPSPVIKSGSGALEPSVVFLIHARPPLDDIQPSRGFSLPYCNRRGWW